LYTKKALFVVLVQIRLIQRKKFSESNVTLHTFQQISDFKIFPECSRWPLKPLWRGFCKWLKCY